MHWLAHALILVFWVSTCSKRIDRAEYQDGEYRIIHKDPFLCIQPDLAEPWKERCMQLETGEIIEVEKYPMPTIKEN
ncbi:MAG: hypothetical protein KDD48_05040 [Bdellovibrionales bacterium]|nr:hypothetical protein [Bdellovibrionales bacterium]